MSAPLAILDIGSNSVRFAFLTRGDDGAFFVPGWRDVDRPTCRCNTTPPYCIMPTTSPALRFFFDVQQKKLFYLNKRIFSVTTAKSMAMKCTPCQGHKLS